MCRDGGQSVNANEVSWITKFWEWMAKWGKVVKRTLSPILVKWWLQLKKKKGFNYSCNPDLTVWVSGHVCVCVFLCHRVHVSVYVTYMQACASAFWLSVHVCMCVPQARQSMLLLGSSPLSPQRPQCECKCVINLTWTSRGVRAAVDLTLTHPSISLSVSLSSLPLSHFSSSFSLAPIQPFLWLWDSRDAGSEASL